MPVPYKTISDLPSSIKDHLPHHAQKIYQEAFNHAWKEYKEPEKRKGNATQEEVAHKVAWSAVKKKYTKDSATKEWVEKAG